VAAPIIDISDWEVAENEFLGTKPKQWMRDDHGVRWLWKQTLMQRDERHGWFTKGDDWSEVLAAAVGSALGVPVARVSLATRRDDVGVISRTVLGNDQESLVHGNEMLSEIGVEAGPSRSRVGYTVDAVREALADVGPVREHDVLRSAFDWFAGYLLLDALIGNTDRHQDNWASIRGPAGRRLSPSFDHASSLGFLLSDEERHERLTTRAQTVDDFARRARSKFDGAPTLVAAAVDALSGTQGGVQHHWFRSMAGVPTIRALVDEIPRSRMSQAAADFAEALYQRNHALLSQALRTMAT
jgi:hypothetical protein